MPDSGPGEDAPGRLSTTVVVVTLDRPEFLRTCLEHVGRQTVPPDQVIVVDSSPGEESQRIVQAEFPRVEYARNPRGPGATATSRDIALRMATGDIVAFLDDDAFAETTWLERLLVPYEDPEVGGVGGRILRGTPTPYRDDMQIGKMRPDGGIVTNFDADPGQPVDVEFIQGASMSFRRKWLLALGGIRDGYPGTCSREESDLCCRVRSLGVRIVFTPDAVVDHVAAPYPKGQRFDLRYLYFHQRNHMVFVIRNFGWDSPVFWRSFVGAGTMALSTFRQAVAHFRAREARRVAARRLFGACVRAGIITAAVVVGVGAGWVEHRRDLAVARGV